MSSAQRDAGASSDAPTIMRWAIVRLVDNTCHRGLIYTVDPEARHLIMLQPSEIDGSRRALVLPMHAVVAIMQEAAAAPYAVPALHRSASTARTADNGPINETISERRRAALCKRLTQQQAPFEELPNGELVVFGCVRVSPPYTAHACRCENEVVLDRFLEMLTDVG